MATYEYKDKLKFMLPSNFLFLREEGDESNKICRILADEFKTDDGETAYHFRCQVVETVMEYENENDKKTPEEILDMMAKSKVNGKYFKIPGTPHSMFLTVAVPWSIFGRTFKMFTTILAVCPDEYNLFSILTSGSINDDDPAESIKTYEYMLTVANSIRVNGKKLPIDGITAQLLGDVLEPSFDGDGESIDISPKIQLNFVNGNETTTYEYTPDGTKEVGTEKLRIVDPDEGLYPHYASKKNNVFNFIPGAVVNASGTEFAFQKFDEMLNAWDPDPEYEERKFLLQKINDLNPAGYTLADIAKDMTKLFRVDKDVFVKGHDRESELIHGYMRRAYMMSAIRSFAWTLADYCKEHETVPEDIDDAVPSRIANFVASRDWLNYDGKTYCNGLCSGSDLHVYFLPDATTETDKRKFLPSQEDKDRVKKIKAKFPTYNEILSEVHSLDALREDLEYIYPAVKILYDRLAVGRDTSEPLEGNESDIVYAWIALAMAAEGPFFTEDGPMNYCFDWPGEEKEWRTNWESPAPSTPVPSKAAGTKVSKNDCKIDDLGTLIEYYGDAKNIVLPEGISAIGEDAFLCDDDITSVVIPEGVETIEDGAFWMCGNLKSVILPSTIRKIGKNAFNATALTSIEIPDGCEELGVDCFTFCKELKDIYVPGSVHAIGDDAFYTFNDATVIHTEKYSTAESTARRKGIKVDYKSAPSRSVSAPSAKAEGESDTESFVGAMGDLSAQVAQMQSCARSEEDRAKLEEIKGLINDIANQVAEGQAGLTKYCDHLEQKAAREQAQEEEKARKKAEAMAAGKSEKDIVNMYIILTNEKKLGQLHRAEDKFFEIYEEDFMALSKSEVIRARKDMLAEMEDGSLCSYYAESFKQRSVEDRFSVSTRNLYNVSENPDFGENAEWAIENSKEWYTPAEYAEVRRLMDADVAETRKHLDDQLKTIDEGWTKFSTAKDSLQIVITDKATDGSDMQPNFSNFQVAIGAQLVSVQIATKGMVITFTTVVNYLTWYWGVTVRDIWEAAKKNELRDEREGAHNGAQLADQALNHIRTKHPETKVTTSNYSKPTPTPSYTAASTASSERKATTKGKTAKRRLVIGITIVMGICIALSVIWNSVIVPNNKYNNALALMDAEMYAEAATAFENLAGCRDADELLNKCRYNHATILISNCQLDEAAALFEGLDGCKDSADKLWEISYMKEYIEAGRNKFQEIFADAYSGENYVPEVVLICESVDIEGNSCVIKGTATWQHVDGAYNDTEVTISGDFRETAWHISFDLPF